MSSPRMTSCIIALIACLFPMPAAHALDDQGAQAVINKFLGSQKLDGASASPDRHVIADLDGDGRPDIVLIWAVLGPTSGYYKMSVFLDQGRNYRTLTTNLSGDVQKLTVNGRTIVIDVLNLGPNDPRCCPSVKAQQRFQWTGQKLVAVK